MADVLYPHRELVCAVRQGVPEELVRYLENHPADNLSILVKTSENAAALAACAPFTAAYPIPETGAAWYLCENGTCWRRWRSSRNCRWKGLTESMVRSKKTKSPLLGALCGHLSLQKAKTDSSAIRLSLSKVEKENSMVKTAANS